MLIKLLFIGYVCLVIHGLLLLHAEEFKTKDEFISHINPLKLIIWPLNWLLAVFSIFKKLS